MAWAVMETAPRDGRLLLLRAPGIDRLRRHGGDWPDVTLGYWSDRMVEPGWYSVEREDGRFAEVLEIRLEPTHWVELP